MKTSVKSLLTIFLSLMVISCGPPEMVNPLSDPAEARADKDLTGIWYSPGDNENGENYLAFLPDTRMTDVVLAGSLSDLMTFKMFPTVVGERRFMNIRYWIPRNYLVNLNIETPFKPGNYIVAEYLFPTRDVLEIWLLNSDMTDKAIKEGLLKGTEDNVKGPAGIITSPAEDVLKYVSAHPRTEIFEKLATFYRMKSDAPVKPAVREIKPDDPQTASTIRANELTMVNALRLYLSAQGTYHRVDYDGDASKEYAADLDDLYDFDGPGGQEPIKLVHLVMAKADVELGVGPGDKKMDGYGGESKPYYGYYFSDLAGWQSAKPGQPGVDVVKYQGPRDDKPPFGYVDGFGLVAFPAEFGKTGRKCFIINDEGTVYERVIADKEGKFDKSLVPKYWPQDEIDKGLWEMVGE